MPYKSEKIKLAKNQDRRIKLTEDQREEIRHKYSTGLYSQRQLAAEYKVSRRLITFVIDPAKQERAAELFKQRKAEGRYNVSKEERAEIQREHRRYKQKLYIEGKLKDKED